MNADSRGKAQQKPPASRDGTPGSQQSKKGAKTNQNLSKQQETVRNGPAPSTPVSQTEHVPLHGFNAAEIKDFLKKGVDPKAHQYKSDKTHGARLANPWHKGEQIRIRAVEARHIVQFRGYG